MKLNDAYPSRYLTAEDLGGNDKTLTIESVDLEEIGQGRDKSNKLVIGFRGAKKTFVVNKTNANTIAKLLGTDETEEWVGQRITIGPREVEFQGDMVWSIRVSLKKPVSQQAAEAAKPKPAPVVEPADQDGGDELREEAGF